MFIQIEMSKFQNWLKKGLIQICQEEIVILPISLDCLEAGSGNQSSLYIFMQLPDKYKKALSKAESIYALIDDVRLMSLTTQEQTAEWQIRMKNLGEGWLPFKFSSDWFQTEKTSSPIPGDLSKIESNQVDKLANALPVHPDKGLELIPLKANSSAKNEQLNSQVPDSSVASGINQTALTKRLKVSSKAVSRQKLQPEFLEWSRQRDPEGIAWRFLTETRKFYPVNEVPAKEATA
jgi:hypothetical protein